jgi:starch phosphorylase
MQLRLGASKQGAASVAYFSMEIALSQRLPTYSGGLGVLAGDTLMAAADVGLPVVAVTLLYRHGYFVQTLDEKGKQAEAAVSWRPEDVLERLPNEVSVSIEGRKVKVRAWLYRIAGAKGHEVPVVFLDTDVEGNAPGDRALSHRLYGGDEAYRLSQEIVLGHGGVAMLASLGFEPAASVDGPGVGTYHMNEGHAALLTTALLAGRLAGRPLASAAVEDLAWVKERCVFTTHTPVPAGHDTFDLALVKRLLGAEQAAALEGFEVCLKGRLNMTELALCFSRFVNGVAKRHAEVSRRMFPGSAVAAITNGVHAATWTADAIRALFDRRVPGWREDNNLLRHACELPLSELRAAHREAKIALFNEVKARAGVELDPNVFTVGFARRATEYKRADLLFSQLDKLQALGDKHGGLQIVFAGKAHPKDLGGKKLIENVFAAAHKLAASKVRVVYVPNYDLSFGRLVTSGVDLWLNNPVKPLEASGTSGMKAAINGVPNLSTLDGWWVEGHVEGVTGWEIEDPADAFGAAKDDGKFRDVAAASIYRKLDEIILPLWKQRPDAFAEVMRWSIALNGPYFNTQRMVLQYQVQAYTIARRG